MQIHPQDIKEKKVLISPLDWGMGHTTRCVSIIRILISNSNEVIFAGNEAQINFIKREFPEIKTTFLKGYNVSLDSEQSTYWQAVKQLNKIRKAIKAEQVFAEKMVQTEKVDFIISDNRYGLHAKGVTNIFLTHQLNLQLPLCKNLINRNLKEWIEKFDLCWIPDYEKDALCHELLNAELSIPKIFIGLLCRFNTIQTELKYAYVGILSGPEPERSRFGKKLVEHFKKQKKLCAIVGMTGSTSKLDYFENPTTLQLEEIIQSSEMIISRAGYTTIMEMIVLEKKAILIPTPRQFEQEYLAKTIQVKNIKFKSEEEFFA